MTKHTGSARDLLHPDVPDRRSAPPPAGLGPNERSSHTGSARDPFYLDVAPPRGRKPTPPARAAAPAPSDGRARHSGSARDPLPPGGYRDADRRGSSPMGWIIAAVAVIAVGGGIVASGGHLLSSGLGAGIAGVFSPRG